MVQPLGFLSFPSTVVFSAALLLCACGDEEPALEGDANWAPFPMVTDFAAPGPFPTTEGPNSGSCTIHRPATLGEEGRKHPVILWGNGTTATPAIYAGVLSHWASHGFIVAAANTSNAGSGQEMLGCLDYLLEQNELTDSPYAGHVNTARVGASGHSQGGAGTLMVGRDDRVSVTAPLQPYINPIPGGGAFDQAAIAEQNGPMFLMSGSADTIARPEPNQQPVFEGTNVPVFWGTRQGADHIASAIGDMGDYRGPATAWFRLHLMSDENARSFFYGNSCALCSDERWVVQRKDIE